MQEVKKMLLKSLKLHNLFINAIKNPAQYESILRQKFIDVWGVNIGLHFLSKYNDAESLIWALDGENTQLFMDKF